MPLALTRASPPTWKPSALRAYEVCNGVLGIKLKARVSCHGGGPLGGRLRAFSHNNGVVGLKTHSGDGTATHSVASVRTEPKVSRTVVAKGDPVISYTVTAGAGSVSKRLYPPGRE